MDDIQKAKNFLMGLNLLFDELEMPDGMNKEVLEHKLFAIENLLDELEKRRKKEEEENQKNCDSLAD